MYTYIYVCSMLEYTFRMYTLIYEYTHTYDMYITPTCIYTLTHTVLIMYIYTHFLPYTYYIIYTYYLIGQYDASVSYVKRLLQLDPVNSAGRQLASELADLIDSCSDTITTTADAATSMPGTSQSTSHDTVNTTTSTANTNTNTTNTSLSQAQVYKDQARIHLSQGHIPQAIDSCESGTILLLTQLLSNDSNNTNTSSGTANDSNNTLSSSEAELIKDELIAIYQLLITAYMSGQNYDEVVNTANAVLDIDISNYRALSKKGEAYHKLVCI